MGQIDRVTDRIGARLHARLRAGIADGTYAPGAALPSTRALAAELGVSRGTVSTVYDQLAAEGFIETTARSRARVAAGAVESRAVPVRRAARASSTAPVSAYARRLDGLAFPAPPAVPGPSIDFQYGALAADDFPTLAWRRAWTTTLVQRQSRLAYGPPEGEPALREALRGYLSRARGLVCDADRVLIVNGSQQAIDLCARVLVDPGDTVVVEDPGYPMARHVFAAMGATVSAVAVDAAGLDTARLPTGAVRLAYVTPSHQFPLGGVLPVGRRHALLDWARRRRAWIVEDDYDGEFRYGQRPIAPLHALDADGRVIYVGTFSKALNPQLRLGYLVLPSTLVEAFRRARRLVDRHSPRQEQLALAHLIDRGIHERHVRRVRRANEARRDALLAAIARHLPQDAIVDGSAAGLHVVVWLPGVPARREAMLVARAREAGVGVSAIGGLYLDPANRRAHRAAGLVLGYASLSPERIAEGIRRLAAASRAA